MGFDGIDARLHEMEVGVGILFFNCAGILARERQIATSGRIAELIELIVGRERDEPCSLVVAGELIGGNFLPLK